MSLSPVLLGSSDTYDHVRSPHAECQFRTKPMDRTPDWQGAVLSCGVRLELSQEQLLQLKSGALLRARSREPGAFGKAARTVGASIDSLRDFIRLHQKDYLSDRAYSEADKDKIEVEVGLFVKTCTQQVEALKLSVLAAQRPAAALPPSPPASRPGWRQQANGESHVRTAPAINEQTAAHLHGVVLSLAEQLHSASSRFDQCRAARYQQLADRESARALLHRHQQRHTDQQQQQQQRQQQRQWGGEVQGQGPGVSSTQPEHQGRASPLHWEGPEEREGQQPLPLGASFQALVRAVQSGQQGGGSCGGAALSGGSTLSGAAGALGAVRSSQLGRTLFGHVREARDALLGRDTSPTPGAAPDPEQSSSGSTGHSPPPGTSAGSGPAAVAGLVTGCEPPAAGVQGVVQQEVGSEGALQQPRRQRQLLQQQQQEQLRQEGEGLVEQLSSKGRAVLQVERTVRELATLNTLFSTAVLHQAEAIEAIYTASVEASQHLKLGNSELRKTMAVNNSSQRYILALLLAATLGLLFFDWFNS